MIIGGSKKNVIENIKKNVEAKEFNKKGELDDPNLSDEELEELLQKFYQNKEKKFSYYLKNKKANIMIKTIGKKLNKDIKVYEINNIKSINLNHGAIITCNHFNPLDSYCIRKLCQKLNKKLYIVIQDSNLALPKNLGFIMNYTEVIPVNKNPHYIIKSFKPELKRILHEGNLVLIYPEEEMWFNYRLPRPPKRGAYQFASELNVPIISCFVEIIDKKISDNEEFNKVKYKVHVLKPLISDKNKSARENSKELANKDYEQKKEAYEKAYNKKLDYTFSYKDIAGYKN